MAELFKINMLPEQFALYDLIEGLSLPGSEGFIFWYMWNIDCRLFVWIYVYVLNLPMFICLYDLARRENLTSVHKNPSPAVLKPLRIIL